MLTLKKNYEFQRVLKGGFWSIGKFICVYYIKNTLNQGHVGFAVSKKYSKSSVVRNRIRRLIKEAYRLNEKNIKGEYDIVIIWKNNVQATNFKEQEIENDLIKCLRKADLLINKEEQYA